jgi:cytochrome b6-f complex iron-sulfur subunit
MTCNFIVAINRGAARTLPVRGFIQSMANDSTRRKFLSGIMAGAGAAFLGSVLYPAVRFIIPPKSGEANVNQVKLPFGRTEIEAEPSRGKTFKFGRQLGLILITEAGELKAMSATCTHLDCTVQYRPDLGIVWCACHNGRYDLDGNNISGPPPRPLEKFVVTEDADAVFVSRENA